MDDAVETAPSTLSGVASTTASVFMESLRTSTLKGLATSLPTNCTVVLPTSELRTDLLAAWVECRSDADLPDMTTMVGLTRDLLRFVERSPLPTMSDTEADLLMDLAVEDVGDRFRPPAFTTSRIMRYKQELQDVRRVQHELESEDRPSDLYEVDRFLRVWKAYEDRKAGRMVDRSDVSIVLTDALARGDVDISAVPEQRRTIFMVLTHGLALVDRTILHLLARAGFDVAIQFAPHIDQQSRSTDDAMWLVSHGWEPVSVERSLPRFHCIESHPNSVRAEVREAIAFLKRQVSAGSSADDVCMIVPSDGSYDDIVSDICVMAGIPISLSRDVGLATRPDVTALYAACRVIIDRWDRDDVHRLARSPSITVPQPLTRLVEASMTFRILGGEGSDAWLRRLETLHAALEESLEDEPLSETIKALKLARDAAVCVRTLEAVLDVPAHLTAEVFRESLLNVSTALGIDVSAELRDSIERYRSFAQRQNLGPLSFDKHVSQWWSIVSRTRIAPLYMVGGLTVARPHELRGRRFNAVAVVGMINGVLPSRTVEPLDDVVLSGMTEALDREALSDIVHCVDEGGVLRMSRPRAVGKDPTVPSPFITEVASLGSDHVLEDPSSMFMLTQADVLAYRDGRSVDKVRSQRGLLIADLPRSAQAVLREIDGSSISPSRLDRYSACPYRYYAERLLGESQGMEFDETLSPIERGSLMHRIAHAFYRQRQSDDDVKSIAGRTLAVSDIRRLMVDLPSENVEALMNGLVALYHQHRERLPRGYLYDDVEQQHFLDRGGRAGILRRWLLREIEQQGTIPFRPIMFELPIEMNVDLGDRIEPVKLRIDRVDAYVDGDVVHVNVVDYKTTDTSVPRRSAMEDGRASQMPLYLASIKDWFAGKGLNVIVESSVYHTFGRNVYDVKNPRAIPSASADQLDMIMPKILTTIDGIRSGRFPVLPATGACDRCYLHELCRVEQWGRSINDVQGSNG